MQIGLVGLGTMGRNLALNMRDHGNIVFAWDPWDDARAWPATGVTIVETMTALVERLAPPRIILLMVKAGEPTIHMATKLASLLSPGDTIIDGGNAYYRDTQRLEKTLSESGIGFLGIGISGGAEGARSGPAMMVGGSQQHWQSCDSMLRSIAARVEDGPCVTWFGPDGAGHFVKMVHNGIEYAVMQAMAEGAFVLRHACGLSPAEVSQLFVGWGDSDLAGYLLEITAEILRTPDSESGAALIDMISDKAGQKGTGLWCAQAGLEYGVPIPSIAEAVAMRQISAAGNLRKTAPETANETKPIAAGCSSGDVQAALAGAIISALAQGFHLLDHASESNGWSVKTSDVARVWRAGSILRMEFIEQLSINASQGHVLAIPYFTDQISRCEAGWRKTVQTAIASGIAVPVISTGLSYLDAVRSSRLPTTIIQAQRDYFGDHGFERIDQPGTHHGPWRRPS